MRRGVRYGAAGVIVVTLAAAGALTAGNSVPTTFASKREHGAPSPAQLQEAPCRSAGLSPTGNIRGSDVVTGTAASELIRGGIGNDTISGGDGNDCIVGGAGFDSLDGGDGTDVCIGGPGLDVELTGCETFIQEN